MHCAFLHDRAYNLRWYRPGLKKPLTKDFSKHHMSMQLRQPNRKPWRWPGGCLLWVMLLLEESMYYTFVYNYLFMTYCVLIETPENPRHGNRGRYYCGKRKEKALQHVICLWTVVACCLIFLQSVHCYFLLKDCRWHDSGETSGQIWRLQDVVKVRIVSIVSDWINIKKKQKIDRNVFIMLYNVNIFHVCFFFQLEWERAQCFHRCSYCPLPWERR